MGTGRNMHHNRDDDRNLCGDGDGDDGINIDHDNQKFEAPTAGQASLDMDPTRNRYFWSTEIPFCSSP